MDGTTDPDMAIEADGPEPVGSCRVLRGIADQPGVATLEGRLVPLMAGEGIRSHVIVMHPGQWCFPHPHGTESLIYTISGRWVFCTTADDALDGPEVRTVIGEGDLFHMAADVPTGFETPFAEGATILILKGSGGDYPAMREAMVGARDSLAQQAADGEAFTLGELDEDHPARVFARDVVDGDVALAPDGDLAPAPGGDA